MGPSHAVSGAATWLIVSNATMYFTHTTMPPAVTALGTLIAAGAAIAADFDSPSSTAVQSLGIVGRLLHMIVNLVSVLVRNLIRLPRDEASSDGHRTLTHTFIFALAAGILTATISGITAGNYVILGKTFTFGALWSLIIAILFTHLALAGLFSKQIKKARKTFGTYILLGVSIVITALIATFLPSGQASFAWLGFAVGLGWLTHILGDAITVSGVPFFFPLPVKGKMWYDCHILPYSLCFEAGDNTEKHFIFPILCLFTTAMLIFNILMTVGVITV